MIRASHDRIRISFGVWENAEDNYEQRFDSISQLLSLAAIPVQKGSAFQGEATLHLAKLPTAFAASLQHEGSIILRIVLLSERSNLPKRPHKPK